MIAAILFTLQVAGLIGCSMFFLLSLTAREPLASKLLLIAFLCGVLSITLWLLQKTIVLSLFSIGLA